MTFPESVVEYLQGKFTAEMTPVCFLIDTEYKVRKSWGDLAWCGLESIEPGDDVLDFAPYLYESIPNQHKTIEYISLPGGIVAHAHMVPAEEGFYAVLLNAKQDHDFVQQHQQSVNEFRLLHSSQQRLITRQRDIISELVETKAELDHLRKEAERSSLSKGEFIAVMSHEFRTPLASIINYADLAIEPDATENSIHKSIEAITRSARHLTALVEAVLDEARLDAGQIELREAEFDLHDLLENLSAMMAPLAADKELSFSCAIDDAVPQRIYADEVRLRQILINLLGNAIKFTVDGGIQITTTYADGRLICSVADTGPGISGEDQERVFQAFERGSKQGDVGAGLGLTISLQLAQLMGGEISLDSTPGQGCTVAVNLPVSVGKAQRDVVPEGLTAPPEESFASQSVSVLVCDDDEDMLSLVEYYLHRAGYGVVIATDGIDAVAKTLKYEPDIVLMDCNLPGLSGIEAVSQLREDGYEKPVVALTASKLSAEDRQRFTMSFRKPAPMQKLLAEIKALTH